MGSIGWYILGYFVLGIVCWILGAFGLVIVAAINDIRWDLKNDPTMKRADTIDSVIDTAKHATEQLEDQCQITGGDPQSAYMLQMLKVLSLWPCMVPKGLTIMWKTAVNLREYKRR